MKSIKTKQSMEFLDQIYCEDSICGIKKIPDNYVHLILSDIPYGIGADDWDVLHDNTNAAYMGSSPAQEKSGAIFKRRGKPLNGWAVSDRSIPKQYYMWCLSWAPDWLRVVKPGASVFIFAGRRYAHRCIVAMEDSGFTFRDMLVWKRKNAPYRAQRISLIYNRRGDFKNAELWDGWRVGNLRPAWEPVLWFSKPYRVGGTIADNVSQHAVGAFHDDAFLQYQKAPDNTLSGSFQNGENKFHPTQKPVILMKSLIDLTTKEGQIILDPFCGSGSTLVAAKELKRKYIGFEREEIYCETAKKRLADM